MFLNQVVESFNFALIFKICFSIRCYKIPYNFLNKPDNFYKNAARILMKVTFHYINVGKIDILALVFSSMNTAFLHLYQSAFISVNSIL